MQHQEKKTSYKPLAIVLVFCLVMAFAQNRFIPRPFDSLMYPFMGYFFLLLSLFKFFDLNAFATAFSTYDLIASRWIPYGYIYPFIEFVLGMLFVSQMELFIANSVTVIVMTVSALGVIKSVLSGQKLHCACLGTVLNVPLSTVSILENLGMGVMALFGLITMF